MVGGRGGGGGEGREISSNGENVELLRADPPLTEGLDSPLKCSRWHLQLVETIVSDKYNLRL